MHALEEQEQQLKRRREQLELEAMLAASNAKLEVLASASDIVNSTSNGINYYLSKSKRMATVNELNPMAREYRPVNHHQAQQDQDWSLPAANPQPTAMLTQQASQQGQAGLNQRMGLQIDDHHIVPPQPLRPPCSMFSQ